MRPLLATLATVALAPLLTLAGCTVSPAPEPPPLIAEPVSCGSPRPQVCTMIYAPVCARHADDSEQTHASACNACADDTVLAYTPGPCDEETP